MSELIKNTQPIELKEFFSRVSKNVYKLKGYYSLYITPSGEILDCRFPQDFGHNDFCMNVYENLNNLPEKPFSSNFKELNIPFSEISYYLMDYFKLLDVMYVDTSLYNKIDRVLLSTEDRICQDMGFVKVAINKQLKTFEVVIPNAIFEKKVTGAQKDVISELSTFFNIDLDEKLKQEQVLNMKIATDVQSALKTLKKTV